jgi:hypothetical protein
MRKEVGYKKYNVQILKDESINDVLENRIIS